MATLSTLLSFNATDGSDPQFGLTMDANGDLFGTTETGGASGDGTVFELVNTATGYAAPITLVTFTGTANGSKPIGNLIIDAAGNLFGTTSAGGSKNDGTVFEIANTNGTYAGTATTLATFTSTNGSSPTGTLIDEANGTLLGTAFEGGSKSDGTVFEIPQTAPQIFSATGTIETFVAPVTGNYEITAHGAQGGNSAMPGGDGASVEDTFALTAGETLQILVGAAGGNSTDAGGGGGGASYVIASGDTPLLIAGGGGGGYLTGAGGIGTGVIDGSSESGGSASISGGAGGGGLLSDGETAFFQVLGLGSNPGETAAPGGGLSFADGGTGGTGLPPAVSSSIPSPADPGTGGFGGGGGGGLFGGGGGGGDEGGSGGTSFGYGTSDYVSSTGGTSYDASANPVVVEGENAGNGEVIIQGPTQAVTTSVTFTAATNGAYPYAGLIADAAGDLFGVTTGGGLLGAPAANDGTVFEIRNTSTGLATTATTLFTFTGTNGKTPVGALVLDSAGDLFGTTSAGGASGDGEVFEIRNTSTGYATTPITLLSFNGTDGNAPEGALILDADGDLFGTTTKGGTSNDGLVFELANSATGYATTPTTLATFTGSNGATPVGGLTSNAAGDLFGSTQAGGTNNDGTEFEITNSGFVEAAAVTIALAVDTGLSATDDVTTNPALTGTGNPNAVVTLTDGPTELGTTVANAAGTWTFTPTLANGTQTVVASETNSAGTNTASLTFTLSTATPDLPVITGISGDAGSLIVTGTADPGDLVSLYNGSDLLGTATASAAENGEWDIAVGSALPQGDDSLTATAESPSGVTSGKSAAAYDLQAGYTSANPLVFGNGNNVVTDFSSVDYLTFGNGNNTVSSTGNTKTLVFGSGTDQVAMDSTATGGWQRNWISIDGSSNVTAQGDWNQISVGPAGSGGTTSFSGSNNFVEMLDNAGYNASDTAGSSANEFYLYGGSANVVLGGSADMVFMSEGSADTVTDNGSGTQLLVNGDAGDITIFNWASDPTASLQMMNDAGFSTAQAAMAALTSDGNDGTMLTLPRTGATIDFADTAPAFIHLSQISMSASWSGGY